MKARVAIILMMLATLSFMLMNSCVKVLQSDGYRLSAVEIAMWRGLVSGILAALACYRIGFQVQARGILALRVVFGFLSMLGTFIAVGGLGLSEVGLVNKMQPILVALLAPLLIGAGESVGRLVWVALTLGFAGTGIILGREFIAGSAFGWMALFGTLSATFAVLSVRKLGKTDHPDVVVFWFQVGIGLVAFVVVVAQGALRLPPTGSIPWLVAIGVLATGAQMALTRAYKMAPAGKMAAAGYIAPLWAILGDIFLFSRVPGWNVLLGGALVIAAGAVLVLDPSAEGGKGPAPTPAPPADPPPVPVKTP